MTIRPAYPSWPERNSRLREVVATMTVEQLAIRPTPERWPIWASVGHLACQRVFWLCVFGGEPGAETTPFPDSGHLCPGDDDLEHELDAAQLVEALDSTFRIVDGCLDRWSIDGLAEEIRHDDWGPGWVRPRGWAIERVYAHDVSHIAELNEALGANGLRQVDLWGPA